MSVQSRSRGLMEEQASGKIQFSREYSKSSDQVCMRPINLKPWQGDSLKLALVSLDSIRVLSHWRRPRQGRVYIPVICILFGGGVGPVSSGETNPLGDNCTK